MDKDIKISDEQIERAAYILKSISHPLRLKIVQVLGKRGPLSVNDLTQLLDSDQSLMSHHLSMMKLKGLLSSKRLGQRHLYSLRARSVLGVFDCLLDCECNYN